MLFDRSAYNLTKELIDVNQPGKFSDIKL